MARKVEVKLVDDIDGGEADETLRFGLDGASYEIDVNAKRADELRANLWQYIEKARRVGRGGLVSQGRARQARGVRSQRAQNQVIRDWAKGHNIELADRGRIPRDIVRRYEAESGE
jgi:hypothetical protein